MTLPNGEKWAGATPGPWADRAPCKGQTELFYGTNRRWEPYADKLERIARAEAICQECPVQADCRQFAVDNREQNGIWGGICLDKPRRPARTKPLKHHVNRELDNTDRAIARLEAELAERTERRRLLELVNTDDT